MRYRDATELTTDTEKLTVVRAINRELSRSVRAVKKLRQARSWLPDKLIDLTASRLSMILSALPSDSWKRITQEIDAADTTHAANHDLD
jgi:hypothetical protein